MSMLKLARNTCRKRRRIQWHFITGIFILFSFGLVYRRLTNTSSFTNGLSNPTQTLKDNETKKAEIRFTKEIEEDRSIIACKVPNVDPFHPSVVKFMRDVGKLNCQGPRFSSYDNNVLRIEGQGLVSAQYRKILRAPGNDFSVVLSDPVNIQNETSDQKGSFHGEAAVDHDFIRVEVVTSSGATKSDVHMHVFPKQEVLKREQKPGGIPLNVALVMFDSTSTANFKRKLPKSWKHLTTNLNSIVMRGETIVGDGTTAQLAAMLTGLPEKNQQDARKRKSSSKTVDSWRWIFKDLKEKGYATCFSEDSPGTAAFNYRLNGFRDPPTDHYGRPFWMEADKLLRAHCVNSRASHNVSFEYLMSFFRRYRDRPRFAFASHSAISHDDINTIGYVDDDLKIFLDEFEKESFLDNTMLIIFSDHGARFSNLRKTLQGKLEERLPFMSITLPKWFQEKYPDLNNNLVNNSHILTSPFDVYATLRHILSYPQYPSGIITGQSLFSRIERKNRTCASTGVADHYCPCLDLEAVSLDEPVVKEIAAFVLKHINDLTSHTDELSKLCQRLQLKEIKSAFREMPKEALQRFERAKHAADDRCDGCEALLGQKTENTLVRDTLYQIQFTTSPNEGFYEVSVRMKQGVPELTAEISRIDAYKNQADCISHNFPLLRKYCYCSTISSSRVK